MTGLWKLKHMVVAASAACVVAGVAGAQSVTEREIAGVDDRYAIASKDFGDGKVQLHTRGEGADGASHKVHTFSCVEQTYEVVFEGDQAPD
ncbi:MAG: hypothetical protein PVI41_02610, partial [Roseobacter sp.]